MTLLLLLNRFSGVRLCDPIDDSPPGSAVPEILQARTLEWVAISFSNEWKWKVQVKSLSRVWLFATPWTAAYQAPPSMGFARQEYWSEEPLASWLWLYSNSLSYNTRVFPLWAQLPFKAHGLPLPLYKLKTSLTEYLPSHDQTIQFLNKFIISLFSKMLCLGIYAWWFS